MRKFMLAVVSLLLVMVVPVSVYASQIMVRLKAQGTTDNFKFRFSANLIDNYGIGNVWIREMNNKRVITAENVAASGFDVNGDQIADLFSFVVYDSDLPDFYKMLAYVVAPGVSEEHPNGIIHYLYYEGGIYQYSVLEGVNNGKIRVTSK